MRPIVIEKRRACWEKASVWHCSRLKTKKKRPGCHRTLSSSSGHGRGGKYWGGGRWDALRERRWGKKTMGEDRRPKTVGVAARRKRGQGIRGVKSLCRRQPAKRRRGGEGSDHETVVPEPEKKSEVHVDSKGKEGKDRGTGISRKKR